jgi:hypothetical protein
MESKKTNCRRPPEHLENDPEPSSGFTERNCPFQVKDPTERLG